MHRLRSLLVTAAVCLALVACMAAPGRAAGLMIKNVIEDGRVVFLNDGTAWDVPNPRDWDVAYNWLPGNPVEVLKTGEMLNVKTGERIDVKRSNRVEESGGIFSSAPATPTPPPVFTHPALGTIKSDSSGPDALTEKRLEKLEQGLRGLEDKMDILLQRMERLEKGLNQ